MRTRGVGRWLLLMGAISLVINLLWFGSVRLTTATNCAMLFRLDLLFVVLIGALLGQERIGQGRDLGRQGWQLRILLPGRNEPV